MLGERGGWYKQYFYEPSARVPLLISEPGQGTGRRVSRPVSLIDLAPTFMDYAASGKSWEQATPMNGRSIRCSWTAMQRKLRASPYRNTPERVDALPCRMIRQGDYKLIYTHGFPDLLYNLRDDPRELNNLAADRAHANILQSLRAKLLKDWDPSAIHEKIQEPTERRLIQNATGGEPNWAFKLRPDDDRRFVRNSGAVQTKARARYPFDGSAAYSRLNEKWAHDVGPPLLLGAEGCDVSRRKASAMPAPTLGLDANHSARFRMARAFASDRPACIRICGRRAVTVEGVSGFPTGSP